MQRTNKFVLDFSGLFFGYCIILNKIYPKVTVWMMLRLKTENMGYNRYKKNYLIRFFYIYFISKNVFQNVKCYDTNFASEFSCKSRDQIYPKMTFMHTFLRVQKNIASLKLFGQSCTCKGPLLRILPESVRVLIKQC